MLEELREAVKFGKELDKLILTCTEWVSPVIGKSRETLKTLIKSSQLILDSKGWPKEEPCQKGEQYWMWNSPHNVFEYGKKIGFNESLSLCLASHAKEQLADKDALTAAYLKGVEEGKDRIKEKMPSVEEIMKELKNIGEYWTICKQDAGRKLFVLPMGEEAIKIKAQAIHSELMKRLKNE